MKCKNCTIEDPDVIDFFTQYKIKTEIIKARKHTLLKLNYINIITRVFANGYILQYKVYKKRLYILSFFLPPPEHFNCYCKINLIENEGVENESM